MLNKNKVIILIVLFIFFIIFSSCSGYRQSINGDIISPDKAGYAFLANEGKYVVFGERTFISHIRWELSKSIMDSSINTGVYSINNDPDLTILYRVKSRSEWYELYIRKELSENDYSFENCNSFKFFDTGSSFAGYHRASIEHIDMDIGIKDDEIKHFLEDIKQNEVFIFVIFSFSRNPFDQTARNDGFVGYVYGFFDDLPNIAFPGTVWQNDDGLYYLVMNRRVFNINMEWLRRLGYVE